MYILKYLLRLGLIAVALTCALNLVQAQSQVGTQSLQHVPAITKTPQVSHDAEAVQQRRAKRLTNAQRQAIAERNAKKAKSGKFGAQSRGAFTTFAVPAQGGTPNYFGPESNWANSPMPVVDPITGAISGGIRKFQDAVPQLGPAGANGLGQYLSVAVPDTTTYPGADYYEIALVQYTQKMHTDLKPTTLRGYVQLETSVITGAHAPLPGGLFGVAPPNYLGPIIVATKNRPVRVKFRNMLPTGAGGNLFLPVDTTEMGAGMGPLEMNTTPGYPMNYTQNRGTLHLHGGATPWISDGTPHQWITPAGEQTDYPKGVSVQNVPDMPDPGPGALTFFYSNQQSARLMFYHDHAYGITRLNVYAGEAAGYVLTDQAEQDLISGTNLSGANRRLSKVLPDIGIPLVIQDKTFVDPTTVLANDPTWPFALDPTASNLWYPHVYMTNQNPNDLAGANALGRWDYGPWFWPPWVTKYQPITNPDGTVSPNLPNLSMTMEAFHDTPLVNGTVYPYLNVDPKTYRFRILNAANDRMWNLGLYVASPIVGTISITNPGGGYIDPPAVTITGGGGVGASALATVDDVVGSPTYGQVNSVYLVCTGSGYTSIPTVTITPPPAGATAVQATAVASINTQLTEIGMVPAVMGTAPFPKAWTAQTLGQPGDILDGRTGGVPDPTLIGPSMIQIGTEGGFLPKPVIWPNIPLGYNRNPKDITVTNVLEHNLFIAPAERADVLVDFSAYAGKTLILYNDAPAAVPAADSRNDYYTGDIDQTSTGGAPTTLPGYGPNTRTIMQIRVSSAAPAPAYDVAALNAAFATDTTGPGVFAASQDPILIPQAPYNSAYGVTTFPANNRAYARIQDLSLTFNPLVQTGPSTWGMGSQITYPFQNKAIHELFENDYGRMNAVLGVEIPFTNGLIQTTLPFGYIDPPTEFISDGVTVAPITSLTDGTQIWKITHNGVDTHPIHFHLFNVQVLNRVGWDGAVKPPEANELGWKETVRMNPLEDCIVAFRAVAAKTPFGVPDSIRPYDPTMPLGSTVNFAPWDPNGNPVTTVNQKFNYGWEYVWHCHILSHEEMDMMRPVVFNVARSLPTAPVLQSGVRAANQVTLNWIDGNPVDYLTHANWGNPANEIGFQILRADTGAFTQIGSALANATTFADTTANPLTQYSYQVVAYNVAGTSASNSLMVAGAPGAPTAVTAVAGNAQATITFQAPASNGGSTILSYTATSNPGNISQTVVIGTGPNPPSITVLGLTNGVAYTFTVTATNVVGTGNASAPSNAVTPATVPGAPTLVQVTAGNAQATVTSYQPPASNGGSPILSYTATANPGGRNATVASGPITVTGLTNGVAYTFTVKATNAVGTGPASSPSASVTPTAPPTNTPAAPSGLAAASITTTSITLSWRDNSNNEQGFYIDRSTNGGASWQRVGQTAANSITFRNTGLITKTTYQYRVQAFNAAGVSAFAGPLTVTTL